jgi:hypothetical protein
MFKKTLLLGLFLTQGVWAVTINGLKEAENRWSLRFTHIPAAEKIGACRVIVKFVDKIDIASITTDAPSGGAWSQIKPELVRSGNRMEVLCVGPAMLSSRITDTIEMFHLAFDMASAVPSESLYGNIIDSIWFDECFDIQGSAVVPQVITRDLVAAKQSRKTAAFPQSVQHRDIGRIHSLTFNLAGREMVKAWVVDSRGRVVTRLVNKKLSPGMHTLSWPERNQPVTTGIYFIQLEINNYTYNKKVSYYR